MRWALRYADSVFRYAAIAVAKSGDVTVASASPRRTTAPGFAMIRVMGPETGASTWVDRSPLNATVPVVRTVGRKATTATVATRIRAAWSGVRLTSRAR